MHTQEVAKIAIDLVEKAISKGVTLSLTAKGKSMCPNIKHKEKIIIKKCNSRDIGEGDVIIYRRDNTFVAHRVNVKYLLDGKFYFRPKGDYNFFPDAPISEEQVIAKVIGVQKRRY